MRYIFLTILLIPTYLFAQNQSEYLSKADSLYDIENYEQSGVYYDKAFEIAEGNVSDYYNAACTWAVAGNSTKALTYLDKSAENGYKNVDWLTSDSDLESLHNERKWEDILAKVQANKEEYEKGFDQELKQKLEKIYVQDQLLRQLYKDAEEKFGRQSEWMGYFWELMSKEDSLALDKVISILEERGWPGKSLVGGKANHAVFMVIQHSPLETQEKYLPLMKGSVEKGESDARNLALLVDRVRMRNGEKQLYGSQLKRDVNTGEIILYPIEDPENVNERRAAVGLEPLETYLKRFGYDYKPEEN